MANELNINLSGVAFTKGTIAISVAASPLAVTVNGLHTVHDQLTLSTTDTNVNKGYIATIGWIYVKNLDITNSILIGADGTNYPILLKAKEYGFFRWSGAAFHLKAAAGTPAVEYMLIED